MNYTSAQLQMVLGVGPEKVRYWKKALSPLLRQQATYTFSDLVALRVVLHLTRAGLAIGSISAYSEALFESCRFPSLQAAKRETLLAIQPEKRAVFHLEPTGSLDSELTIVVPIGEYVSELMESLGAPTSEPQLSLALPLAAVGRRS